MLSQFYVTITNIIKTCSIINYSSDRQIDDLKSFLDIPFKILNQFDIDSYNKTELHRCLRLSYLISNFLKYELPETHLQVHINYLMGTHERLLKTIFEKEKNVALIVSKIIKEDYIFFDLLMEFLEQVKLQPSRLTAIQEVLNKYDVLVFVEKTINQIEFTAVNGQFVMSVKNKYFSSLSNFKKLLDFINILLRNNVSFCSRIFAASSKDHRNASIFKFIILAHVQSSLRPVYHNTLVAINTLFYSFGDQFLDKADQITRIGDIFLDIIEQYNFINDLNFFKLVEVLIMNNQTFLLRQFNERLNLLDKLVDDAFKLKSKKRQLLAIKIIQHLLQFKDCQLSPERSAAFYELALLNLHRNSNNLLIAHLQPILLSFTRDSLKMNTVNIDFENLTTGSSDFMNAKSTISSQ